MGPLVERKGLRAGEVFGIRSLAQLGSDLREVVRDGARRKRFQFAPLSVGLLRPRLSIPAYLGKYPASRLAPIYNFFDRTRGGQYYSQRVTRSRCRDHRGGRLTYDEHDGTDFVCPIGTPLVAAAPGIVVMVRERWLRGGLTVALDHGGGLVTHYTHASRSLVGLGQIVLRGEPVAWSGAAGYDLVQFFPWVPPHIHFTVTLRGRPIDPFLAEGEEARAGTWLERNRPRPASALPEDARVPVPSAVSIEALERASAACSDARIVRELEAVRHDPPAWAALLEDALHHDRGAWGFSEAWGSFAVRPEEPCRVRVSLPLGVEHYDGAVAVDTLLTRAPRPSHL